LQKKRRERNVEERNPFIMCPDDVVGLPPTHPNEVVTMEKSQMRMFLMKYAPTKLTWIQFKLLCI
jgi:hypothetical protein